MPRERRDRHDRGGAHGRHLTNALDDPKVSTRQALGRRILGRRKRNRAGPEIRCDETGIDSTDLRRAPDEQPSRDQQHERQRYLAS